LKKGAVIPELSGAAAGGLHGESAPGEEEEDDGEEEGEEEGGEVEVVGEVLVRAAAVHAHHRVLGPPADDVPGIADSSLKCRYF